MRNEASLRQLLRVLCHNTQWNYAVFWKLKQESEMILTWDADYFDEAKTLLKSGDSLYDESLHIIPGMISFVDSKSVQYQRYAGHPIKVALEKMKCHHYLLGEGFVGEVALSQGHYWIFPEDMKFNYQSNSYKGWQLELAANIKTLLLVCIKDYGVVQLGSLEKVVENLDLVLHIRVLFCTPYPGFVAHDSLESSIDCSNSTPVNLLSSANSSISNLGTVNSAESQQLLTVDPNLLPIFVGDHNSLSQNLPDQIHDIHTIFDKDEIDVKIRCNYLSDSTEVKFLNYSSAIPEGCMSELFFTANDTKVNAQPVGLDYISVTAKTHYFSDFSVKDMTHTETEENCKTNSLIDGRIRSLPIQSEQALGKSSVEDDRCFFSATVPIYDRPIASPATSRTAGSEYHDYILDETSAWFLKESDTEYLLDEMVRSLQPDSDADVFSGDFFRAFSNNYSDMFFDSYLSESEIESSVLELGSLLQPSEKWSTSLPRAEGSTSSPTSSCKSVCMSTNEDNKPMGKVYNGRKLPIMNKRGGRNSNSHKPRPRDRQLIQDRVKELRQLIPNGSKCSIDTLLDRTVNHMLFLQSISCRAELLKQTAKGDVKSGARSCVKPQTQANGAYTACEQGRQPEVWPIVVEYLDQPGQILVEVLCNDNGLFLEIAHIIRRLELTILKGVLESRSDNFWAHFVIEASRGFHRMHILWPLMQLLQRNYAPLPSCI